MARLGGVWRGVARHGTARQGFFMQDEPLKNGRIHVTGAMRGELPPPPGRIWVEGTGSAPAPANLSKFALSEMADEWHFFNHGALFRYGGMEYPKNDPVADWYEQQPIGTDIIQQPFKSLVFEGLDSPIHVGPLTWGNVICGVRKEYWDSLLGFLGGVATVDHKKKLYAQTFTGDVEILDPVLVERFGFLHPAIQHITITMFCIDASEGRWEIRPPITRTARPTFVRMPARPEVVEMGRAVLSGDLAQLQHKDNPAFQQTLDKFKSLRGGSASGRDNGNAHGRRR